MTHSLIGSSSLGALLADGAATAPSGPAGLFASGGGILPIVIMFGIFYFLLIRPQQKRQRELQDWLKSIKKGDEVVTTGGLWGKVSGVADNSPYVTLELQEKVRVRVLRANIAGKAPTNETQAAEVAKSS